jgi:hypothetical protein
MIQEFSPGDFLVFQLEAGYGLLRVIDVTDSSSGIVWHLAAYSDLFLEVEQAEQAIKNPEQLGVRYPHIALTSRAFESTQVAKIVNTPLIDTELRAYRDWIGDSGREVSDRSIRLLLGLR